MGSSRVGLLDLGKVCAPRPTHILGSVSYPLSFTFAILAKPQQWCLYRSSGILFPSRDSPVSPCHWICSLKPSCLWGLRGDWPCPEHSGKLGALLSQQLLRPELSKWVALSLNPQSALCFLSPCHHCCPFPSRCPAHTCLLSGAMQEMDIDPSLKLEAPPWEMVFINEKNLLFYIDCGILLSVTLKDSSLLLTQDFNFSLQVNFVVCQLFALLAAIWFRTYLHSSKTSSFIRHIVATLLGLYLAFFCFGW